MITVVSTGFSGFSKNDLPHRIKVFLCFYFGFCILKLQLFLCLGPVVDLYLPADFKFTQSVLAGGFHVKFL